MVQAYQRRPKKVAPDTEEAEVKARLKRFSPEVKARKAEKILLDDPLWRDAFEAVRKEAIAELEAIPMDGSEASEAKALENVRQLQALLKVKQAILRPLLKERNAEAKHGTPV